MEGNDRVFLCHPNDPGKRYRNTKNTQGQMNALFWATLLENINTLDHIL